jgi:hypothetical protein
LRKGCIATVAIATSQRKQLRPTEFEVIRIQENITEDIAVATKMGVIAEDE